MRSLRQLFNRATAATAGCLLALFAGNSLAGVIQVGSEYEVTYAVSMHSGTPTGGAVQNVMIFEWDGSGNRSVDAPFSIAPTGVTTLRHRVAFAPTSALLLGYLEPGPETANKKVLYTVFSVPFSEYLTSQLLGVKFSDIFSQGERATYTMITEANSADEPTSESAIAALWAFIDSDLSAGAFDPRSAFNVHRWTPVSDPVGNSVPIPATLALLGLGLTLLGRTTRRSRTSRSAFALGADRRA